MAIGFDSKMMMKSGAIGFVFRSWGLFRIYQLISTSKPALYNWAGGTIYKILN